VKLYPDVWGHPDGAFLEAYENNLAKQNEHALEASQVAQAMIRFIAF
jgi:hypothetical protein